MQDLIKQEQFEIEVLDRLKGGRFLDNLIFTGGTMNYPRSLKIEIRKKVKKVKTEFSNCL